MMFRLKGLNEFPDEDNKAIIDAVNADNPDLLWISMTAPKQEKWASSQWNELDIHCHVGTIGAVFDFFAGTVERAPIWWQEHGLEWLYRLMKEPSVCGEDISSVIAYSFGIW